VPGAGADGIAIAATSGASLSQLVVQGFAGDGISVHAALLQDGFEHGPGGAAAPNPQSEPTSALADVVVRDNGRNGVRALGGLDAQRLEADGNAGDGVLVDSATPGAAAGRTTCTTTSEPACARSVRATLPTA
jgi:hypothetical protein